MDNSERFRSRLSKALEGLDVVAEVPELSITERRRRRGQPQGRERTLQFLEHDGVVTLREGRAAHGTTRRAGRIEVGGELLEEIPFSKLGRNDIRGAIDKLDEKLTGRFGLYGVEMHRGRAKLARDPVTRARERGKILLLIHGTFSNCETLLASLQRKESGRAFTTNALERYDQVLAFNHRTLGTTPMINAREIFKAFRDSRADVHIICHSRGGLVARSWLESMDALAPTKRKVVFVGSPLAGTSLAAPPNLRAVVDLLANIGNALGTVSAAVPFLAAATGLFQIFTSVASLVAKTPVVDAAVSLVPGLEAQSRVSNNRNIVSFRNDPLSEGANYFAVQSNFEPTDNRWRFWRNFRDLPGRAINFAADPIFQGPNDLVVDTVSMSSLADGLRLPAGQVLDFGKNARIHHCNYFEQPELYEFLDRHLSA